MKGVNQWFKNDRSLLFSENFIIRKLHLQHLVIIYSNMCLILQEYYEERWIPDPFINSLRDELSEGQEKLAAEKEKRQEVSAAKAARKQAALLKSLQGEDDD